MRKLFILLLFLFYLQIVYQQKSEKIMMSNIYTLGQNFLKMILKDRTFFYQIYKIHYIKILILLFFYG